MATKVISTRIDEVLIERFDEKAAAANITRNELIAKLISDFLGSDGIVDNAVDKSIQVAVDNAVDSRLQDAIANLRSSIDSELRDIKHDLSGLRVERMSEKTDSLVIENLQTNLAIAQNRINELSKKIEGEATAPENFTQALLHKAVKVAPLMLQKSA